MRTVSVILTALLAGSVAACGSDSTPATPVVAAPTTERRAPDEVLVCVDGDASDEEVRTLFARVSVPHESGIGTDLMDGIAAVSARTHGVAVEFESSATTDQRAEILEVLEEPPVVAVRSPAAGCP